MAHCNRPIVLPVLLVLSFAPACGLSYEPKSGLEGGNAEEVGRNILADAQSGQLQCAIAAGKDGWVVRHGRDPDVYDNELYVPEGKNVVVQVTGGKEDLSLEIPQFGVRKYIESGKRTKIWFRPRSLGDYTMRYKPVRGAAGRVIEGQVHVITLDEWNDMFR